MVYTPHHYDDLVLLTKRYLGWVNIDLLGLSRGRHKSLFGSIVLGKKATRMLFGKQIGEIQKECYERLGQRPVLIGETGLHFDVGLDKAQQSGNFQPGSSAGGIKKRSIRTALPWSSSKAKQSTPKQNVTATIATSKQFQNAFDNILNGLDRTLAHYTLWNYTVENDAPYGDGWNGENLSLYSSPPSDVANTADHDENLHEWDRGGRAIEQFCRPYPVATIGQPVKILFDRHQKTFKMSTRAPKTAASATTGDIRTEIYVPKFHFRGAEQCDVKVSDGTWEWDQEMQILFWTYGENNKEGGEVVDHWIEIQKKT
ncbi:hypothetical protein BGZ58_008458 [Dissophora ornata]|nr:hypothetical protein BGZ58_008458 [Dissophora ornata]